MKKIYFYNTKTGKVGIAEESGKITNLVFGEEAAFAEAVKETPLIKTAAKQLFEYLDGKRRGFDLPLAPMGTEFQQAVWSQLCKIPYGSTSSYKQIAAAIHQPCAARAVGMANNSNPIPIFIPCHRVIGANGDLKGYIGGIEIKKLLLEIERENIQYE